MLKFNYSKDLSKVSQLKENYLREQVIKLKNIHQPVQKSPEWYEMRNTMITASDWGNILEDSHISGQNDILLKKCGEDKFFTCAAMDWGNKYEEVANLIYQYRNNVEVLEFGCLRHPFIYFLGASPDGITPDGVMLEIKCPVSRKITGVPPIHYWYQVQGQLEVCDLDRCDFLECSLKEYDNDSEELYLNDNYEGNYMLNSYGNEKGVIAQFYRKTDKKILYEYSNVCIVGETLKEWKDNIINLYNYDENIVFTKFTYWKLVEVSCIPIYRNQEWFNEAKEKLEFFWNKVLKYRELGIDKLKEDIQVEKELKKDKKQKIPVKSQKKINDFINLDGTNGTNNDIYDDIYDDIILTTISFFSD